MTITRMILPTVVSPYKPKHLKNRVITEGYSLKQLKSWLNLITRTDLKIWYSILSSTTTSGTSLEQFSKDLYLNVKIHTRIESWAMRPLSLARSKLINTLLHNFFSSTGPTLGKIYPKWIKAEKAFHFVQTAFGEISSTNTR